MSDNSTPVDLNNSAVRDFTRTYLEERLHAPEKRPFGFGATGRIRIVLSIAACALILGLAYSASRMRARRPTPAAAGVAGRDQTAGARLPMLTPVTPQRALLPTPISLPVPPAPLRSHHPMKQALANPDVMSRKPREPRLVRQIESRRPPASAHGSDKWIADPLHGEALRQALIEDRASTARANEAQLGETDGK